MVAALLSLSAAAHAAPASSVKDLKLYATIQSAGVTVTLAGDDDSDARVSVEYRVKGAGEYTAGHPLLRLSGGRFKGSLFYLQPNTSYEVRVTLNDPDNAAAVQRSGTVKTRADAPVAHSGKTIHVSASQGNDTYVGNAAAPLASVGAAVKRAAPGDRVLVHKGVYYETVTVPRSGTSSAPIWIQGEPGAVLDGADKELAAGPGWTHYKGKIYVTDYKGRASWYVAAGDDRLYHYTSLAALEQQSGGQSGKTNVLKGGFYVDSGPRKIYVWLPSGASPTTTQINAATRQWALYLDRKSNVVIDGLELRHYGVGWDAAIDLRGSSRIWVRNCKFHHLLSAVWAHKGGGENVIERNTMRDTSVYTWPWSSVKDTSAEQSAITLSGGRGDVARYNTIEGFFNGIYSGMWGTTDEAIGAELDVYLNTLSKIGDDGFEPEGACVNQRFWGNRVSGVHNGISLSPIETGPVWFIRTSVQGYEAHMIKLNNSSKGHMLLYHNTGLPGSDPEAQVMFPPKPFGNLVTRNNIFVGNRYVMEYMGTTLTGPVEMDYDDLYTNNTASGGPRFVKWKDTKYSDLAALTKGTGLEAHGFSVKPRFANLASGDLTLVAGHALLDRAQPIPGVNHLGLKGAPDVGAVERGGKLPGADGGPGDPETDSEQGACSCRLSQARGPGLVLLVLLALAALTRREHKTIARRG